MKKLKFYIVDVFAEEKYAGNQLAVFHVKGDIPGTTMQNIAKEMNYSETTFILSGKRGDNGYDVRIFTPDSEVPFAGHPTLGTAFIIQREIVGKNIKKVKLNLPAGQVPVAIKYKGAYADRLWMRQMEPVFGEAFGIKRISEVLTLDTASFDSRYPVQDVSTGLPFIIVPLRTLDDVKTARIDAEKYHLLIEESNAKAVFIFCPEPYSGENDLNARMFADYYGIQEDPATGSANGCLAAYLVKYRYFGSDKISVRVEQGYEIKRPSLLYLRAEEKDGGIEVHVGGKVVMVAEGVFV